MMFSEFLWGLLIILIGTFCSSISTVMLYGFGELIDKVSEIAYNTSNIKDNDIYNSKKVRDYTEKKNNIKLISSDLERDENSVVLNNESDDFTNYIFKILIVIIILILFLWLIFSYEYIYNFIVNRNLKFICKVM